MKRISQESEGSKCISIPEYVEFKLKENGSFNPTIFYEQFHRKGHPTHPLLKSKDGLTFDEILLYSPEFGNKFEIQMLALNKSKAGYESIDSIIQPNQLVFSTFPSVEIPIKDYFKQKNIELDNYIISFVHPWQFKEFVLNQFKREIEEKDLVVIPKSITNKIRSTPLISVRSLILEDEDSRNNPILPSIKVSLGVGLTNRPRFLSDTSSKNAPNFSKLMNEVLELEKSNSKNSVIKWDDLIFIKEFLGVYYTDKDHPEKNIILSSLWRENINKFSVSPQEHVVPLPSLFNNSPISGRPLLFDFIKQYQQYKGIQSYTESIKLWYREFIQLYLSPFLVLFSKYGISLESHIQNNYCIFRNGVPIKFMHKDFDAPRCDLDRLRMHINLDKYESVLDQLVNNSEERQRNLGVYMLNFFEFVIYLVREVNQDERNNWLEHELHKISYQVAKSTMNQLKLNHPEIKEQISVDENLLFAEKYFNGFAYFKWMLNPTLDYSTPPLFINNPWYHCN
eukprot:gene4328-5418_t